jgi:uncharacterized protein YecT (DUF1311 family)
MNSPEAPCRDDASTFGMANCSAGAREHADRELQKLYEQVRTKLPDDFPDLQKAERLWLQFRDATCSAEQSFYERYRCASGVSGLYGRRGSNSSKGFEDYVSVASR